MKHIPPPVAYILLLDDEEELRLAIQDYLENEGHHVVAVSSAMRAEEAMVNGKFDVAILDVLLPDGNGLTLLKKFKESDPDMGIILITGYAEINTATQALRWGADDFLSKPCDMEDILASVNKALAKPALNKPKPRTTQAQQKQQYAINQTLIGESAAIKRLQNSLLYFAQSAAHTFISGEAGTGKTKLATALHALSKASATPALSLDCKQLSVTYDFSTIQSPTLILENIDFLEAQQQQPLLNFAQAKSTRIISTSSTEQLQLNQTLHSLLQTIAIHLSPLHTRGNDILLLAEHFLAAFRPDSNTSLSMGEETKELLRNHRWAGNVSALRNCIEQAALSQQTGIIEAVDLPLSLQNNAQHFAKEHYISFDAYTSFNLKEALGIIERNALCAALDRFNWNQFHTAKFLCLNRTTLIEKIKKRGLKKPE